MKIALPQLGKRIQMNAGCRWETLSVDASPTVNGILILWLLTTALDRSLGMRLHFRGLELRLSLIRALKPQQGSEDRVLAGRLEATLFFDV